MQTVRDDDGNRYVLLDRSTESCRVRDPATGAERSLPSDELTAEDVPPLVTAASGVAEPLRRVVTAVHDERSLGLLVELADREAVSVVELLSAAGLCESDLHGLLSELRAAGLVTETTVHGERGYAATETAVEAVAALRGAE